MTLLKYSLYLVFILIGQIAITVTAIGSTNGTNESACQSSANTEGDDNWVVTKGYCIQSAGFSGYIKACPPAIGCTNIRLIEGSSFSGKPPALTKLKIWYSHKAIGPWDHSLTPPKGRPLMVILHGSKAPEYRVNPCICKKGPTALGATFTCKTHKSARIKDGHYICSK